MGFWPITAQVGSYLYYLRQKKHVLCFCGRCSALMVSVLNSRVSALGSSPGWGHCVVFLGKTLFSHGSSLIPGVYMGTGKFNAGYPYILKIAYCNSLSYFCSLEVLFPKRERVFHRGIQTPRNKWKHEAAGRVLLLFRGVWIPRWNTKHEFWK